MKFAAGAPVYSAIGLEVGRLSRFVVHPTRKRLTHLIIHRGTIFTSDHVLPLARVHHATTKGVLLHDDVDDVRDHPHFEETVRIPVGDFKHEYEAFTTDGMPDYPITTEPRYVKNTRRNIPGDTLALKATAQVTSEDHQPIGHIEGVEVDPKTGYVTHVVIARGLLMKARKRVPGFWCRFLADDEVYIPVDSESLKELLEDSETPALMVT